MKKLVLAGGLGVATLLLVSMLSGNYFSFDLRRVLPVPKPSYQPLYAGQQLRSLS
jgi:hypothetical protein